MKKQTTEPKTQQQLIQEAAELLQQERIAREQAFTQEYSELVEQLCKKHGCKLSISQPQLIIQAL